ncbi:MAG: hypothetical protein ABFS56_16440 [Pseudomonadota bacterium]
MKRIAIFTEGKTERIFVKKLLEEIAGRKNISIKLYELRGGGQSGKPQTKTQKVGINQPSAKYEALIYDCGGDEKVTSDIIEQYNELVSKGVSKILGLRDLYGQKPDGTFRLPTDLVRAEKGLKLILKKRLAQDNSLPIPIHIVIAVMCVLRTT